VSTPPHRLHGQRALVAGVRDGPRRCRRWWSPIGWGEDWSAEPAIAVVVQRMVDATRSGVMFSADRSGTVVEAAFGLGEVVSGAVDAVAATQAVGVSSGAPGTRRTAKAGQMAREVNAREAATV